MRSLLALLVLSAVTRCAEGGVMPATPAVLEIPIPPLTNPEPATGTVSFLNSAGEELSFTIESETPGPDDNGLQFLFAFESFGVGAPETNLLGSTDSGFVVQLNTDNPPELWELSTVVNDLLPGFRSTYSSAAADLTIASLPGTSLELGGGRGRGGITQDVLLELTGPSLWIELFLFVEGTSAEQLASSFNLFTDANRVEAGVVDDVLVLSTIDVGYSAFLFLDAVIEAGGENDPKTFTDALGEDRVFVRGSDAVVPEAPSGALVVVALLGVASRRARFRL